MKNKKLSKSVLKRKAAPFAWSFIRLMLLIGISYTILYPLMSKIVLVFMDPIDLQDFTVTWIPRNYTLSNIKLDLFNSFLLKVYKSTALRATPSPSVTLIIQFVEANSLSK